MKIWDSLTMLESIVNWPYEHLAPQTLLYVVGVLCGAITLLGTWRSLKDCELRVGLWPLWFGLAGGFLSAGLLWMSFEYSMLRTPEVAPSLIGERLRIVYYLSLLCLLMMITATDLKDLVILEWTCWLGMGIGVVGAVTSGEFQLAHVWVDWNQEIPQLRGPYIPEWLAKHPHLHGLAWSAAGIATGVILTWSVRWVSSRILQMNTLGSGDIYLMAMIGAYLGWQPTLIAFLLAPLFALIIGGLLKVTTNRPALPYGPFLALGAITVLFTWRWIWMAEIALSANIEHDRLNTFATRRFFGDPIALFIVLGGATVLFVALLGLLKLYHNLPISSETRE